MMTIQTVNSRKTTMGHSQADKAHSRERILRKAADGSERAVGLMQGGKARRGFATPSRRFQIHSQDVADAAKAVGGGAPGGGCPPRPPAARAPRGGRPAAGAARASRLPAPWPRCSGPSRARSASAPTPCWARPCAPSWTSTCNVAAPLPREFLNP